MFWKIWTFLIFIVPKSGTHRNVTRFPLITFQIHCWTEDHGHQWSKAANAWQQCGFMRRAFSVTATFLADMWRDHVLDRQILPKNSKILKNTIPNTKKSTSKNTTFPMTYLLNRSQDNAIHRMCIDMNGMFRAVYQCRIHFRFQWTFRAGQLNGPITSPVFECSDWFSIHNRIVFIAVTHLKCVEISIRFGLEILEVLTFPSVALQN